MKYGIILEEEFFYKITGNLDFLDGLHIKW